MHSGSGKGPLCRRIRSLLQGTFIRQQLLPDTVETQWKAQPSCRHQGKNKITVQGNCLESGQHRVLQENPGLLLWFRGREAASRKDGQEATRWLSGERTPLREECGDSRQSLRQGWAAHAGLPPPGPREARSSRETRACSDPLSKRLVTSLSRFPPL